MIKIEDEAFLLSKMKFSESSIIVSFLTKNHGILKGIIRNAFSKKNHNIYEIGNKFNITANSRLDSGLHKFTCEIIENNFFELISDKINLLTASVASELIYSLFPENLELNLTFRNYNNLIDLIIQNKQNKLIQYKEYLIFELMLQKEMGYELDLSSCAVCESSIDLKYISPKTGRAVCYEHGNAYENKIFLLPKFLLDFSELPDRKSLEDCAKISEHFLNKYYFKQFGKEISYMRNVLLNKINKEIWEN
jgi:DNA repair protein RecO (recombination protein O)